MTGIFISYKRDATGTAADRLADDLRRHFGQKQVFFDLRTLEVGARFDQQIERAIGCCNIAIIVIGKRSLSSVKSSAMSEDFFLLEVQRLLDREIPVIPILVGGVQLPEATELPPSLRCLVKNQAFEITSVRWDVDVKTLIGRIENLAGGRWKKGTSTGAGIAAGTAGGVLTNMFIAPHVAIPIVALGIAQPLLLGGAAAAAGYAGYKVARKLLHKL